MVSISEVAGPSGRWGITAYLENGGTVENTQAIAAHESPRTTKLYNRRGDQVSLDEIEVGPPPTFVL